MNQAVFYHRDALATVSNHADNHLEGFPAYPQHGSFIWPIISVNYTVWLYSIIFSDIPFSLMSNLGAAGNQIETEISQSNETEMINYSNFLQQNHPHPHSSF